MMTHTQPTSDRNAPPAGNWVKCIRCRKILFTPDFERTFKVCPSCGHHHRLSARERIDLVVDAGSFQETNHHVVAVDGLGFPEYKNKLASSMLATGSNESVVTGVATMQTLPFVIASAEFGFMGGSMGGACGERLVRAMEMAIDKQLPFVSFASSGGARMQEGLMSLMQMARTCAAVQRMREAGVPYISVLCDPAMAGVLASYASVADVIIAEPGALIGFAGQRVAQQAQVTRTPSNFQSAEYQMEHGMIDMVVFRRDMRTVLSRLLRFMHKGGTNV